MIEIVNNQRIRFNSVSYVMLLGMARTSLLCYIHETFPTCHFKHGKPKRLRKSH